MMSCHDFDTVRAAYLKGELGAGQSSALEAHAATCERCGDELERLTRLPWSLPAEIAPSPELRSRVLRSAPTGRPKRVWFQPVAIAAGVVLTALVLTPERKPAQQPLGEGSPAAIARASAAPPLALLDAAAAELSAALAATPGDPGLEDALARLESQRRSLITLVEEFES